MQTNTTLMNRWMAKYSRLLARCRIVWEGASLLGTVVWVTMAACTVASTPSGWTQLPNLLRALLAKIPKIRNLLPTMEEERAPITTLKMWTKSKQFPAFSTIMRARGPLKVSASILRPIQTRTHSLGMTLEIALAPKTTNKGSTNNLCPCLRKREVVEVGMAPTTKTSSPMISGKSTTNRCNSCSNSLLPLLHTRNTLHLR